MMAGCLSEDRYARQTLLSEIGVAGQARLKAARILIIGIGGLGSPAALYLCAAGIGTIGLADGDRVALSNLQRQILFTEDDIGKLKVVAAETRLRKLNSDVTIKIHPAMLTAQTAAVIIADYDLVIDGTDNFTTHYLLNDACVLGNKPLIYGSAERFAGEVGCIIPHTTPCYRCLYPEPPPAGLAPTCGEIGILGVVPGLIGSMQTAEALKFILGLEPCHTGKTLRFDLLTTSFRKYTAARDPSCALCSTTPTILSLNAATIDSAALYAELQSQTPPTLIDVRSWSEFQTAHIADAILIPLDELEARLTELTLNHDLVVYCQSGIRSAAAVALLCKYGFTTVRSLEGGIVLFEKIYSSQLGG